jgi:hypothetical protein
MEISNPRYVNDSGWYDVTVTPDEGGPFEYTVGPIDDAPLAVAIRAAMAANPIPIAAYLEPVPTVGDLLAHAAKRRWQAEVGGMTWNGWPVATDDRSQGKIQAEVLAVQLGKRADGEAWKFGDGEFRPLTNEQVEDMAGAARTHVANCFVAEGAIAALIASGGITAYAEIDVFPWPG